MASRGSVIPLFIDQVLNDVPITITDPEMTRFMMTLDDAVDLVIYAFKNGNNGDIFVQRAPAITIYDLAQTIKNILGKPLHPINIIGTRHGEKVHEVLLSRQEMALSEDLGMYFRIIPDGRDLNYSNYFDKGSKKISDTSFQDEYTSYNTERLNIEQMKILLLKHDFIKDIVKGKKK